MKIKYFLIALTILFNFRSVLAQDWPNKKPVRVILPVSGGSVSDSFARIVTSELTKSIGGVFIMDYRPGAVGTIATEAGAKAPADGYTLVLASAAQHSVTPWLVKNVPYDPVKDFAHIGKAVELPFLLVITPSLPIKSFSDFISYAKSNPGKLAYGFATGSSQLAATLLNSVAGINTLSVPYKTPAQGVSDLIAGRIQFMFLDLGSAMPLVDAGQLRGIAVSSRRRATFTPNIPTIAELGYPDYEYATWLGFAAPQGTPREIIQRLNIEITKVLAKQDVQSKLVSLGMDIAPNTVVEQEAFIKSELDRWGKIIRQAGIIAE